MRLLRLLGDILIFLVVTMLVGLSAEWMLSYTTVVSYDNEKEFFDTRTGMMICYSTNESNYLPIDLRDPLDFDAVMSLTLARDRDYLKDLSHRVPYCIVHDTAARERGYFGEREKLIAIVGDSFTYGEGVKPDDTLGYILSETYPEFNFINMATSGAYIDWVPGQLHVGLEYPERTSHAVYFYNINDVLLTEELVEQTNYLNDFQNVRWSYLSDQVDRLQQSWVSRSHLFHLIHKVMSTRRLSKMTTENYLKMYFDPANEPALNRTIDYLKKVDELVRSKNAKLYVVLYPLLHKDLWGNYPFAKIHSFMLDVCKKHGITCFDAAPAFDEFYSMAKFRVHRVDYHPNGLANRLVVEYLKRQGMSFSSAS